MHDRLGEAVAVAISGSGQFIAVSSPKNEDNCVLNSGEVDVYEYSEQSQLWIPEEASIHSRCRFYDKIGEHGLSWRARCCWITERQAITTMLERVFEPHRVDRASNLQ